MSTRCRVCSDHLPNYRCTRRTRALPEMFRKAFKLAETECSAAFYLAVPEHPDTDVVY